MAASQHHDPTCLPQLGIPRIYRIGKLHFVTGVACALFFSTIGIGSTLAALWNIDGSFPNPEAHALVFGVFWSCWTLASLWFIVVCWRLRLIIHAEAITHVGVFFSRTLPWSEITGAKWWTIPAGGTLVLRGPEGKISIEFAAYRWDSDLEPIHFFHHALAENLQNGWDEFESRSIKPARPAGNPFMFRLVTGLLLLGFAIVFIVVWTMEAGDRYLALSIVNALCAVFAFAVAWIAWKQRGVQGTISQESNSENHS